MVAGSAEVTPTSIGILVGVTAAVAISVYFVVIIARRVGQAEKARLDALSTPPINHGSMSLATTASQATCAQAALQNAVSSVDVTPGTTEQGILEKPRE